MPVAITKQDVINAQPLQARAIAAQPRPIRIIYIQPTAGNFNQMPVVPVPAPTDCASRLRTNDAGFCIGLASSGVIGFVGAGVTPWIAAGFGHTLSVATAFGFGSLGAAPGLACAAGVTAWGYTKGGK